MLQGWTPDNYEAVNNTLIEEVPKRKTHSDQHQRDKLLH